MASGKNTNKATAKKELSLLLSKIDSIFESEPAVLRIDAEPVMIIGDIHGDLQALNYIMSSSQNPFLFQYQNYSELLS